MKKYLALAMFVVLAVVLVSPFSVSAKTKAGVKSGSFFYFFDKTFERANLFFTFSLEKKAKKALENAEERLAEAEELASENKPEAVKTAMENYQKNIEVLEKVLEKVPEEAKEAIEKAIEADKERREEMTKKIEEINNEIKNEDNEDNDFKKDEEEKSNDDVGDNESGEEEVENGNGNKDENKKDEQSKEIEKLKKEVETLKQKQPQIKIIEKIEKIIEKPVIIEKKESSSSQINSQTKQNENIITLPNGSVVEMDEKGNVVRTIKEVSIITQTPNQTVLATQTQTSTTIQILSVNVTPSLSSAQIEWQTNIPTNSKIFLSGGSLSSKVYSSESGLSTRHIVNATGLTSGTTYSYEIESIAGDQIVKKQGSFTTKPDEYTISIQPDKTSVQATGWNGVTLKVSTLKNGQIQSNQSVSMVTPDSTQNDTRTTSNLTSTGSGDWHNTFTYYPKTIGNHTLLFSWNGISKSVNIQAVEYVKIDPKFERLTIYQQDANNSSYPVDIPEYTTVYQNATIANFNLTDADEPFKVDSISIKLESDIDTIKYIKFANGSTYDWPLNYSSTLYQIKIGDTTGIPIGAHTLTIKEIRVIGQKSGLYRTVTGLPITFTFIIK